jgi:hypothetical protein
MIFHEFHFDYSNMKSPTAIYYFFKSQNLILRQFLLPQREKIMLPAATRDEFYFAEMPRLLEAAPVLRDMTTDFLKPACILLLMIIGPLYPFAI